MIKKLAILLLFLTLCFLMTGCVKYSYVMDIDVEDNITISEIHGINEKALKNFGGDVILGQIDEQISQKKTELEQAGYTVENYKDTDFKGYKMAKTYTVEEFKADNLPNGFSTEKEKPLICKKSFLKNICTLDLKFDFNQIKQKDGEEHGFDPSSQDENVIYKDGQQVRIVSQTEDYDENTGQITKRIEYDDGTVSTATYNKKALDTLGGNINDTLSGVPTIMPVADFTIKIPGKVTEHNATNAISAYEYQWDLAVKEQPVEIKLTYEKFNWINLIVFAIVIAILFKIFKRS